MSPDTITVAMPYWRTPATIARAAESILAQTHTALRLVVVNDGDTETPPWPTLAHIADPRLVRFDLTVNQGRYFADAVTLAACDTPWFAICDADTLPEREPLLAAIDGAHDGRLHLPYTRYRSLTRRGLAQYRRGDPLMDCEVDHDHEGATGGVIVIRVDAWWRAGGMDERFQGWGHEDAAFRLAADTLLGPTVRHPGAIHHLWHAREWNLGSPEFRANAAHMERYTEAGGDQEAMLALVKAARTP